MIFGKSKPTAFRCVLYDGLISLAVDTHAVFIARKSSSIKQVLGKVLLQCLEKYFYKVLPVFEMQVKYCLLKVLEILYSCEIPKLAGS